MHRLSACAPIMPAKQPAERLNIFNHDAPSPRTTPKTSTSPRTLSGLAFANGCRTNIGPSAWGLGTCFQHNHKTATCGNDIDARNISNDEALTDRAFGASTMVRYVC